MPRVSCWDADEIRWVNWHSLPNPLGYRPQLMPAKGVLKLIGLAAIIAGVITLNLSGAAH
jgi:hypothetical protein